MLPNPDGAVDVEVGPVRELLRLTYNALVVQQVSGALDRAGLSRLEAARRAGIDPVTFARRITGGTFTIAELGALADACGVRASVWLRHGDDTLAGNHKLEAAAR